MQNKEALKKEFEMKYRGPTKRNLGMDILRDRSARMLSLSQKGYFQKVLKKFGIDQAKLVSNPIT